MFLVLAGLSIALSGLGLLLQFRQT
ncbi:hypothetical protein FVC22_10325 [Salmonella enterica]|nr:hypothetical protein [Salmonella enterica]